MTNEAKREDGPIVITAQQALTMNIARQRDSAMNRVAELEVENAQLAQVNRDLGALCETQRKQIDEFKGNANGQPANGRTGVAETGAGAGQPVGVEWDDGAGSRAVAG